MRWGDDLAKVLKQLGTTLAESFQHPPGTQSPWTSVTSGVPQGSVLGPTLFTTYINDIDENIKSQILKFADDTKIMAPVSNQEQIIELQEDLASAFHWAGKWQMAFNPGKCKCVHFGHANPKHEYRGFSCDVRRSRDFLVYSILEV